MDYVCVDGQVSVDGKPTYSGLFPRFDERGLEFVRLYRKENLWLICSDGPHIEIAAVSPSLLTNVPQGQLWNGAHFSFSGPYLGIVDECGGLAARDGVNMRRIVELQFEAIYRDAMLRFSIAGVAGRIEPETASGWSRSGERLTFSVVCAVPLSEVARITPGRTGLALREKLESDALTPYRDPGRYGPSNTE